jgi:hypothetical protein
VSFEPFLQRSTDPLLQYSAPLIGNAKGQALVEGAIVLSLLVLLLFGAIALSEREQNGFEAYMRARSAAWTGQTEEGGQVARVEGMTTALSSEEQYVRESFGRDVRGRAMHHEIMASEAVPLPAATGMIYGGEEVKAPALRAQRVFVAVDEWAVDVFPETIEGRAKKWVGERYMGEERYSQLPD